jgi:hypothetical protein
MSGYDGKVFGQWASRPSDQRYSSLAALRASVVNRQIAAQEQVVDLGGLHTTPVSGGVALHHDTIGGGEIDLIPTHYSFAQLMQRIGWRAANLRDNLGDNPELLSTVLNHSLQKFSATSKADDRQGKLYYHADSSGDYYEYNAFNSPTYGRVYDAQVVGLAERIVDMSGGAFYSPHEWGEANRALYASDHDCFMFFIDGGSMVDGGGERDQLHRGFYLWNSEVGDKTVGMRAFLFQVVCGNFQILGQQDVMEVKIRHNGRAPERVATEMYPEIRKFMESSAAGEIETIRKLKQLELPVDQDDTRTLRVKWAQKYGFTKIEAVEAISTFEREVGKDCSNVWQFMDGATMHARTLKHLDAKEALEIKSGKLAQLVA